MNLSADELVTELKMSSSWNLHLLVEGESDRRFYPRVIQGRQHVNVVPACGAEAVVAALSVAASRRGTEVLPHIIGIIDRDYRVPCGLLPNVEGLLTTDLRDLECMMIASDSLHDVLEELGSREKVVKAGGPSQVRDMLVRCAEVVGEVRYLVQKEKRGTSFRAFPIEDCLDTASMSMSHSEVITRLNSRQADPAHRIAQADIERAKTLRRDARDLDGRPYFVSALLVCRGHDLMALLGKALRKRWGSNGGTTMTGEKLEHEFRLSYPRYFGASDLAKQLHARLRAVSCASELGVVGVN